MIKKVNKKGVGPIFIKSLEIMLNETYTFEVENLVFLYVED